MTMQKHGLLLAGMICVLSLLVTGHAAAESCDRIMARMDQVFTQSPALSRGNPQAAAVFQSCAASAAGTGEQNFKVSALRSRYQACAQRACNNAGNANGCLDVSMRLFDLTIEAAQLDRLAREQGCS